MTTRRFAEKTTCTVDQTLADIKRLLKANGAESFAQGETGTVFALMFELHGRRYRMIVPMPTEADVKGGRFLDSRGCRINRDQVERSRLRALLLVLKAKIEAAAIGLSTLEDELLPSLVLPDDMTFAQWSRPQVERAYCLGEMPPLLALGPGEAR